MDKNTGSLFWPIALPIWTALMLFYCYIINNIVGIGFFVLLLIVGIVYFIYRFRLWRQERRSRKGKAEDYNEEISIFDGIDVLQDMDSNIDIDID